MGCIPFTGIRSSEKPKANSTGTMDYFNYPLLHPHTTRTHSRKDGGYELEFISFLFAFTSCSTALFNNCGIYKKSRFLWGLLCLTCLLATALGALGLFLIGGKIISSPPPRDVPASTVILPDDSLSMNAVVFPKLRISSLAFLKICISNRNQHPAVGITAPVFDKPTSDPNALGSGLKTSMPTATAYLYFPNLTRHSQLLLKETHKIILLSDFRKQDWQDWDGTAVDAFRERLSSTPIA